LRVRLGFTALHGVMPVLLALTNLFGCILPFEASAQQAKPRKSPAAKAETVKTAAPLSGTYEVAKGDTLFRIAGRARVPGATLNQTVLALYRANPEAFFDANINQLVVGRLLKIPSADEIKAVDAAKAGQELKALLAKPVTATPPSPPPVKETPPAVAPRPEAPASKRDAKPPALNAEEAGRQYKQAVELERTGDLRAAMKAYTASADSGNGEAQKRLGDIYNTGNSIVKRDYETALKWYQKARAQGIEIPKPIFKPGVRH
jgi:FimV-like protein